LSGDILDAVIVITVGILALIGLSRGLIKELSGLIAVVLGVLGGFRLSDPIAGFVLEKFGLNPGVASVVAFTIVFLAIATVVFILSSFLSRFVRGINLGWVDKLFGLIFGLAKGAYIVSFFLIFLSLFSSIGAVNKAIGTSKLSPYFTDLAPKTYRLITGKDIGITKITDYLSKFTKM
jgi:membrane protein required for colicin V production